MMPKADPVTMKAFESLLPDDPRIVVRPMFGHKASFINGNMFAGTFGSDVFVRLDAPERSRLLAVDGAKPFEPMKGRPMSGYVQIPRQWLRKGGDARTWLAKALAWTAALPPKLRTARAQGPHAPRTAGTAAARRKAR